MFALQAQPYPEAYVWARLLALQARPYSLLKGYVWARLLALQARPYSLLKGYVWAHLLALRVLPWLVVHARLRPRALQDTASWRATMIANR